MIKWRNWTWWESYLNTEISDKTQIAIVLWPQCPLSSPHHEGLKSKLLILLKISWCAMSVSDPLFHPTTHHWWPIDDLERLTPLSASHLPTFSRTYSRTPPTQYLKVEPQETDSKVSEKHDYHLQWRKNTHIKWRLLYQAMILYNYVPVQNGKLLWKERILSQREKLCISKGYYCIKQWFSTIMSLFKKGTSLKGKNLLPEGENSFLQEQFLKVWKITFTTLGELPWVLLF